MYPKDHYLSKIKSKNITNAHTSRFEETSKTTLQRPAARYDALGKIGGGYGSLVSMFSRFVSRCPWLPKFGWVPNKGALSNLLESLVE